MQSPPSPHGSAEPMREPPFPGSNGRPSTANGAGPPVRDSASGPPPGAAPTLSFDMVSFFWRFLWEDRWKLWTCFVLLFVTGSLPAVAGLVPMLLTSTWHPGRIQYLWWGLAGLLALSLLFQGLQYVLTHLTAEVSQNFGRRLRRAIFEKLANLPAVAMNLQSVGSLAYRSTSDVMRIQDLITPTFPTALSNAAQLLFMIVVLFVLGPAFATIGLVLIALIWLLVARVNRRVRELARVGQKQNEEIMTRFIEGVGGYRDLVAAGRFAEAVGIFDQQLDQARRISIRTSIVHYWSSFVPVLGFTLFLFAYYFSQTANTDAVRNVEYIGKVISFASIIGMVQAPALRLMDFFTQASLAAPSFAEVRNLLLAPEVQDISHGRKPQKGDLTLDRVSFSYGSGAPPILDRVSFHIAAGSFTAIVGQTGSGKSTLFYLLLRLLEPHAGEIRVGGIPLREMSLADLRQFIAFIPQSPFIFDTTIRENLSMGVPKDRFEEQRLNEAIRMAQLEKLLGNRTQAGGLEAPVGPAGATLSGGERQRIALGRVFLRDPQIIVCDEYTANIDNATARLIHQALAKVFAGKTRVVITHQLYTVRGADEILVLDGGQIVDRGTHNELVQRPGLYREMWEVQRLE